VFANCDSDGVHEWVDRRVYTSTFARVSMRSHLRRRPANELHLLASAGHARRLAPASGVAPAWRSGCTDTAAEERLLAAQTHKQEIANAALDEPRTPQSGVCCVVHFVGRRTLFVA
jgi:hypothetical protein